MSWIEFLDNNGFLGQLYPDGAPSLETVRLHELQLLQDGPTVSLRFDLSEYPSTPPEKWCAARANTLQVRLLGIGVQKLEILGWTSNNLGRLILRQVPMGLLAEFQCDECRVVAVFDHIRVDSVAAYRDEA